MSALMILGLLLVLIGGIWFLVEAFRTSILWGLGCLIVPLVSLIFFILNIGRTWKPFAIQIVGVVLMVLSMGGMTQDAQTARSIRLPIEQPMDLEVAAGLMSELKSKGIRFSYTNGVVYVQADQVEQALGIYRGMAKSAP